MIETSQNGLASEIRRRRTFAIISHPDAGKTTLTEKLLLYGGAIRLAGSVKARRAARHATSDWMEIEKQRGISVTSSVMQFEYNGCAVNILDTPGHQDFSEDTYRTLAAADAAVMLIDGAKGVEAQTIKLFHVCRMRGIPIFTFVNKMDREGKDPFALMEEIEQVLGMRTCPMNWPVGMGADFHGVYDREKGHVELFDGGDHGQKKARTQTSGADDPALAKVIGDALHQKLQDDIALLDIAGDPWDYDRFRRGELSPLFWGSALTNFGVQPFLEYFLKLAPTPAPRTADKGEVNPEEPRFSGFVFKIQANMNPAHRDRIAFLRIVSGKFERGMAVKHVRLGKEVKLSQPQQFMAQDRQIIDEAYAGDIIGLFDPGIFRIGDTLVVGDPLEYEGIPSFSPEHFARVSFKDAMKSKHFQKGLDQLTEEGAIQVFYATQPGHPDPILGAVGELQFEVFQHRMKAEYGVDVILSRLPYELARWVDGEGYQPRRFWGTDNMPVTDKDGRDVLLFRNEWSMRYVVQQNEKLRFRETAYVK
ncbi:MAG: peptide chain release factor 3 [Bacillota bacterium]